MSTSVKWATPSQFPSPTVSILVIHIYRLPFSTKESSYADRSFSKQDFHVLKGALSKFAAVSEKKKGTEKIDEEADVEGVVEMDDTDY